MAPSSNQREKKTDEVVVLNYLRLISVEIATIGCDESASNINIQSLLDGDDKENCGETFLDIIVRQLLFYVCNPAILSSPLPHIYLSNRKNHIIKGITNQDDINVVDDVGDGYTEKESSSTPFHQNDQSIRNRTDALRNVLRSMAPIAIDVCTRVAKITLSTFDSKEMTNVAFLKDSCQSQIQINVSVHAFILFSHWLYIAPQLAPIVANLFASKNFINPLDNDLNENIEVDVEQLSQQREIVAEAAHKLCKFYSDRGDNSYVKSWWDWTPLLRSFLSCILPNDQEDMEIEKDVTSNNVINKKYDDNRITLNSTGGWAQKPYSHNFAAMWHSARAISYLFNFSPAFRVMYYRNLAVQEEMVPCKSFS